VVEVDAKYIKGMINNPDIQPSASINQWISAILLFDFRLRHVPGKEHGPDGLSRRPRAPEDPEIDDDYEEWINTANSFSISQCQQPHLIPSLCDDQDDFWWPWTSNTFAIEILNEVTPVKAIIQSLRHPILSPSIHTSFSVEIPSSEHSDHSPSSYSLIPCSDKAKSRDLQLEQGQAFLLDPKCPPDLSDDAFKRFVRYAAGFFIQDGRLWKKDSKMKHKLVVPDSRRFELIQQAHDEMGHKGIFTVRMRLLERFWWPQLDQGVRWFIKTCHECQTRLLHSFHIPPTIPIPLTLFRKAYIDTMFMPRSNGFCYIVHARCSLSSYPE
jgi:hypothetical protein